MHKWKLDFLIKRVGRRCRNRNVNNRRPSLHLHLALLCVASTHLDSAGSCFFSPLLRAFTLALGWTSLGQLFQRANYLRVTKCQKRFSVRVQENERERESARKSIIERNQKLARFMVLVFLFKSHRIREWWTPVSER